MNLEEPYPLLRNSCNLFQVISNTSLVSVFIIETLKDSSKLSEAISDSLGMYH